MLSWTVAHLFWGELLDHSTQKETRTGTVNSLFSKHCARKAVPFFGIVRGVTSPGWALRPSNELEQGSWGHILLGVLWFGGRDSPPLPAALTLKRICLIQIGRMRNLATCSYLGATIVLGN